jgi:hypothetical protein
VLAKAESNGARLSLDIAGRVMAEDRRRAPEHQDLAEAVRMRAQGEMYERLAKVLHYTARIHCPDWRVVVDRLDETALPRLEPASGNQSHVWNTWKLDWWCEQIAIAPDGARVLLIDGDTFICRSLDDAWMLEFDMAITMRHRHVKPAGVGGGIPFNAGVVFLRVSDKTRAFMESWRQVNFRFLCNASEHEPWRKRYAGINQAALGFLLEQGQHGCDVRELPCSEWNCCEWGLYDAAVTRIVHVKSGLRGVTFDRPGAPTANTRLQELARLWRRTEKRSKEEDKWHKRPTAKNASSATGDTRLT